MKKLIAIVGPTGSGKTKLACDLAHKFNGVIISADSRQVYRGLDIGTNKEGVRAQWMGFSSREKDHIPQLLVDIADPGTRFTLADWLDHAYPALETIWKENKLPIVTGGTGLYVSALVSGYVLGSGRYAKNKKDVEFEYLILETSPSRKLLYQKSDARYEAIIDQISREIEELAGGGVDERWFDQIGLDYQVARRYRAKVISKQEAISLYRQKSHSYIRRQLTWWRHHEPTVKVANKIDAKREIDQFLRS
jgi:tRNA A37 N6-isopentenylltransferase MiaA